MKICHVVPSLQEHHGGPSKSVRALCRALARAGHSVELLTTAPDAALGGSEVAEGSLRVRAFRRDWPESLCVSSELRAALDQTDAEIIHHHALWLRSLHYARRTAVRRGVPLVVSPRGMMSEWAWHHHHWRKSLARMVIHPGALAATAGWHTTSAAEEAEVRALGFSQPACVAPNGVDEPEPTRVAEAAEFWRALCPQVATRPTALFYGRFHQKKRVIELIDVWLERAPANWLLLLVGLPEDYTPEVLERYVQKMSGAGRVRAFSGAGHPAPYPVAKLFLLPSHNENFGLVVAEAMAHAVPALVTDTTPWLAMNTQKCGWCVPWTRFGAKLAQVTSEPIQQLQDYGEKARTWAVREFSWDRSAVSLGQFYRELLARPRA